MALGTSGPDRFNNLREAAWDRFLTGSHVLHEAHYTESETASERLIGLLRNMLDLILRLLGTGRHDPEPDRTLAPGAPDEQSWAMTRAPEQVRPVATAPYIAQWEQQFDSGTCSRRAVTV